MKKILVLICLLALPALASRDGSGNYALPAGNPVTTGTLITSTWANNTLADLATEMQDSLSRSGKGGMLAAFKFADGSAGAPSLTFTNEQTSGVYRAGATDIRVSLLGNDTIKMTPSGLFFSTGGGTPVLYRIPNFFEIITFFPNKMINNQTLARLAFTNTTVLLTALPNAVTFAGTAATGATIVTLNKRTAAGATTAIGTLTWSGSGTVAAVSFTADITFAPGDFLEMKGPATADATLADVSITLQARRQ